MNNKVILPVVGLVVAIVGVWLQYIVGAEPSVIPPVSALLGFLGGMIIAHD